MKGKAYIFSYYWLPVMVYMALIFIQSSHPMPEKIPQWPLKDKLFHFVGYAILGVLVLRALRQSPWRGRRRLIMAASILFTALYGMSDEWHQYYVPSRSAEVADILADVTGGLCGVWVYDRLSGKFPAIGRL